MKKAVILGAGITGLRIGAYLAEEGYNVTVIEKSPKVGGMTASFAYKDFILDYGPHKFYTQIPGVYDDFKQIVGDGNYLTVEKKNSIRLLGRYFDFPVKLSQLILRINPLTSAAIALEFSRSIINKRKALNYEDYFVNGFGRKGYEIIFKGFAEKVWGNPRELSVELAQRRSPVSNIFDVLKTALVKNKKSVSAETFLYPTKGYGVMCDKLANKIIAKKGKILLSTVPSKILVSKGQVKSIEITQGKQKKKLSCDVLISSLAITELPSLISPSVSKLTIDAAKSLKFRSLVIAYVFLNKKIALKDNWIFFPEKEFCFNRVAEQKSFSAMTCPDDKTVLTAEITCDFGDSTYAASDEEIRSRVVKDLEKAGLIKENEVYEFITRRAGRVYPVYSIDCKKRLAEVFDSLDDISNLYSVGRLGLFNYNNADHCLDMARVVANLIIQQKPVEEWKKARDYFDTYKIVD